MDNRGAVRGNLCDWKGLQRCYISSTQLRRADASELGESRGAASDGLRRTGGDGGDLGWVEGAEFFLFFY